MLILCQLIPELAPFVPEYYGTVRLPNGGSDKDILLHLTFTLFHYLLPIVSQFNVT
jgi:hypothetical protein